MPFRKDSASMWLMLVLLAGYAAACPSLCTCSGRSVSCRGLGLTSVPPVGHGPNDIPVTTQHLDLSENRISRVHDSPFMHLSQLKFLNLQHNKLSELPADMFAGLNTLARLYLSYNQIRIVHDGLFKNLQTLSDISMVGNPSQCDVDGDCDCAPGLLSGKGFCADKGDCSEGAGSHDSNCPANCRCTREDERVIVECFGQDLRSFPKGIPLDVTDLDLGNNAITSLANELSKFKQIQELRLESNKITMLRRIDFSGLNKLKFLFLDENNIQFVEQGVFQQMASLERVVMSGNPSTCRLEGRGAADCTCASGVNGDGSFCMPASARGASGGPKTSGQQRRASDTRQHYQQQQEREQEEEGFAGAAGLGSGLGGLLFPSLASAVVLVGGFAAWRRRSGGGSSYEIPMHYGSSSSARPYW